MPANPDFDVVTIRMSRSELHMPWGFTIQHPCVVRNVEGGSLADKAGLQNDDTVHELQFEQGPSFERANDLMQSAKHELNIIVLREPAMTARIWKPNVSYGKLPDQIDGSFAHQQQDYSKLSSNNNNSVRVSLQHQPLQDQTKVYGFNQGPRQFGNTPMAKFDPNAPSFMRSEALRMIQENEKIPVQINNTLTPPECFGCGRVVIGLMCNAFDKNLHPDCFQCSTCGTPLAQQGHHFINDKFYCEVHGHQRSVQQTPPTPPPKTVVNPSANQPHLKTPSRPFNTATQAYQNPESVVQPTNRFGQSLTNATKLNNNIMSSSVPSKQALNATQNRGKVNQQKSPAFQRRRKLQKQWPPSGLNPTQKNAQALRFWKYNFERKDKNEEAEEMDKATKLKTLIHDFDSGKIAEMDAKIARVTPSRYTKRLIPTPNRLQKPMRTNPFAWSNAELPSGGTSPQPPSSTVSSSSSNIGEQKGKTKEVKSKKIDTNNENKEDEEAHEETSWKFLSQIMEEQDILTESTLSSLKSSLSIDSITNKKSDCSTPTPGTQARTLTRAISSVQMPASPQIRITSSNSPNQVIKDKEVNEIKKEEKAKNDHKIKIQKSMLKQESFGGHLAKKETVKKHDKDKNLRPKKVNEEKIEKAQTSLDEFVEIEKVILKDQLKDIDADVNKIEATKSQINEDKDKKIPSKPVKQAKESQINEDRDTEIEKMKQMLKQQLIGHQIDNNDFSQFEDKDVDIISLPNQNVDKNAKIIDKNSQQANKKKTTNAKQENKHENTKNPYYELIKPLDDLLILPSFIDFFPVNNNMAKTRQPNDNALPIENMTPINKLPLPNRQQANLVYQQNQQPIPKYDQYLSKGSVGVPENFHQKIDVNPNLPIFTSSSNIHQNPPGHQPTNLQKPYRNLPGHQSLPRHQNPPNFLNLSTAPQHFHPKLLNSLREHSTDGSSLDLPPQMPELSLNEWGIESNRNSHSSSNKSLVDCFIRTGDFLDFIEELNVLKEEEKWTERHKKTMEMLNQVEKKMMMGFDCGEFEVQNDFNHHHHLNQQNNNNHLAFNSQQAPIDQSQNQQRQHGQLYNAGGQMPRCEYCSKEISGSFVLATGKTWCPEHFTCANLACNRRLLDCGFVEEAEGKKYCEKCFETLIAPSCAKCGLPIVEDCLNALQRQYHPECFVCAHCRQSFGNTAFYLENGQPYCEKDWNQLFTTKCVACKFPIEAGDRWIEAIGSSFHSNCFNCFSCQVNLEGQNFYARDGHPFCRAHA